MLGDVTAAAAFDISGPADEGFIPLREATLAIRHDQRARVDAGASGTFRRCCVARAWRRRLDRDAGARSVDRRGACGQRECRAFRAQLVEGFALDPYVIRTALTPATKLIVISNAHNPSGAMAGRDALEQVGVMAEAIGARVLVDEVYAEAQYDEAPLPGPAATFGDVFVSTSSLTKAYGLAGLRCGWIIASPSVSGRVRAIRDVIDGSGPYVAERLSLTAFEHIDRLRSRARQILAENLSIVRVMARSHPRLEWLEPAAGTTAFPRVKDVDDTRELVERLIRDHDTVVVPGHFFQAPQHIRIAFGGRTEMLREAMRRLDLALRG